MKRVTALWSSVGFLLLSATPAFAATVTVGIEQPGQVQIESLPKLLGAIIGVILIIAFIIAFFYLLWGGVQWITSGGDKSGVEAAQKKIQAALIGLVIVASVWALFTLVGNWLGFSITNLTLPDPTGTL